MINNFEYLSIGVYVAVSLILAIIIFYLSYGLVFQESDFEKTSAYECGFLPFESARSKFDVRFYIVAILFIVFDLEITFLFPWAICLNKLTFFGFFTMAIFLIILTIGFIYEWKKGALDWN